MSPSIYFLLKVAIAPFGLILQLVLFEIFGTQFTSEVNKVQIWALFASFLICPGIEFSILRTLPKCRQSQPLRYQESLNLFRSTLLYTTIAFLIFALFCGLYTGDNLRKVSVVAILSYLFLLTRILPIFYRIEEAYYYSVSVEQGAVFLVATSAAVLLSSTLANPIDLWLVTGSTFMLCVVGVTLAKGQRAISGETDSPNLVLRALIDDYSPAVALISISNFSILWLPVTVGTFLMASDEIVSSVSMLRTVGMLLFIEAVMSSYYLPKISRIGKNALESEVFNTYKNFMTAGTLVVSLIIGALIYAVQPFGFGTVELVVFAIVALVQILVCSLGSPFSMATILCGKSTLKKLSMLMVVFSGLNVLTLLIVPKWETILIGFALLQIFRALIGLRAMKPAF